MHDVRQVYTFAPTLNTSPNLSNHLEHHCAFESFEWPTLHEKRQKKKSQTRVCVYIAGVEKEKKKEKERERDKGPAIKR